MKHLSLLLISTATLFAGVVSASAQDERPRSTGISPNAGLVTKGAPCAAGEDFATNKLTPPDDNTEDNPPAGALNIIKSCDGITIGTFSAEVNTPDPGDFIHIEMFAKCAAASGQSNPCTVGQVTQAAPGHQFLRDTVGETQTHSVTMVWPNLKKGRYLFQVRPGGNGTAFVEFRTFTVTTYGK